AQAPLFRLSIAWVGEDHYMVLISFHHMLLDGWSVGLILREVATIYAALAEGRTPEAAPRRPFRDYIAWLLRQDLAQAESYWRRTLADFVAPTPLGGGAGS